MKKFNLHDIEIKSFITALNQKDALTINSGLSYTIGSAFITPIILDDKINGIHQDVLINKAKAAA